MDNEIIMTDKGQDILMSSICGCEKCAQNWTLSDCESHCGRYFICNNVAIANDILAKHE